MEAVVRLTIRVRPSLSPLLPPSPALQRYFWHLQLLEFLLCAKGGGGGDEKKICQDSFLLKRVKEEKNSPLFFPFPFRSLISCLSLSLRSSRTSDDERCSGRRKIVLTQGKKKKGEKCPHLITFSHANRKARRGRERIFFPEKFRYDHLDILPCDAPFFLACLPPPAIWVKKKLRSKFGKWKWANRFL